MTQSELAAEVALEPPAKGTGPRSIHTANLDHIVQLQRNPRLRQAYENAWIVTADGMPVFVYAKLRGATLRTRVTGADLFGDILALLRPGAHRCFFVASSDKTARLLIDWLATHEFSRNSADFDVPPRGFESDARYSRDLARRIAAHGTTHLFLGVGAPKSEIWVNEHRDALGDCYVLCAGAGPDFFAGTGRRAPRILQRVGFEWLWRFGHEPRRLFRRYFIDSWSFFAAVADDLRRQGAPVRREPQR
jgi:N-acetylglucosaminyldiphosphoundecaprenol N-acetyl-beta-D-mannosaminyltransferase